MYGKYRRMIVGEVKKRSSEGAWVSEDEGEEGMRGRAAYLEGGKEGSTIIPDGLRVCWVHFQIPIVVLVCSSKHHCLLATHTHTHTHTQ